MAAISCPKIGRNCTGLSKAQFPAEELLPWSRAPTTAGRNAITTGSRRSWCCSGIWWRRRQGGRPCAQKRGPIAVFPAHWAPNDLALYDGHQFPDAYRGGAFIAFHGSWNRLHILKRAIMWCSTARGRQTLREIRRFADGFAGAFKEPAEPRTVPPD